MRDLDPGRSGREDYNPETEGKPADRNRSRENNPEGMQGAPSDPNRGQGQQRGQQSERDRGGNVREPDRGAPTDPSRTRPGSTGDELNDEDSAREDRGRTGRDDEDSEELERDR